MLQIKDRHNGNILIDSSGHIIHIDFGFLLGTNPGGINFENAPFKLTKEYVEIMGGVDSEMFLYFKLLLFKGFIELKAHVNDLAYLLLIMKKKSDLPCFQKFNIKDFKYRFKRNLTDHQVNHFIHPLGNNHY